MRGNDDVMTTHHQSLTYKASMNRQQHFLATANLVSKGYGGWKRAESPAWFAAGQHSWWTTL